MIKKSIFLILSILILSVSAFAGVNQVEEVDGSPSMFPWKVIFDNGSLTNNGDSTVTHSIAGFSDTVYKRLDNANIPTANWTGWTTSITTTGFLRSGNTYQTTIGNYSASAAIEGTSAGMTFSIGDDNYLGGAGASVGFAVTDATRYVTILDNVSFVGIRVTDAGVGSNVVDLVNGTRALTVTGDSLFTGGTTTTGTIQGGTLTDGTATLSGGNLTGMGNITGTDVDISAGTGDLTIGGKVS